MHTYPTTALGRSQRAERARLRSIARARRARQRMARSVARLVILAAFLATLGLVGWLETAA